MRTLKRKYINVCFFVTDVPQVDTPEETAAKSLYTLCNGDSTTIDPSTLVEGPAANVTTGPRGTRTLPSGKSKSRFGKGISVLLSAEN